MLADNNIAYQNTSNTVREFPTT